MLVLGNVSRQHALTRVIYAAITTVLLGICPLVIARDKAPKRIKPGQNVPQYAGFAEPLPQTERLNHAVERLTFGPNPGDDETIQQIGLKKWIDLQLHPERVPENPILIQRLEPLAALRSHDERNDGVLKTAEILKECLRSDAQLPRLALRSLGFWYSSMTPIASKYSPSLMQCDHV